MASSVKEMHCSDCIFFTHSVINALPENKKKTKTQRMSQPINCCSLRLSGYLKERLAFGDDLTMCDNGRTDVEEKILSKGW